MQIKKILEPNDALLAEIEYLRMENEYLKKIDCLSSKKGKIRQNDKIAIITELKHKYKLTALLETVQMVRSTYYYHLQRSKLHDKYEEIKDNIVQIYHENQGQYGYRRITLELRNRGYIINHKMV